jgi:hypothetical protein
MCDVLKARAFENTICVHQIQGTVRVRDHQVKIFEF